MITLKSTRYFLVLLLTGFLYQLSYSQTIPNLKDIKVDELTDEQVIKFIEDIERAGYSDQQIELLGRERGIPSSEISKLKRRVEALRSQQPIGLSDPGRRIRKGVEIFNQEQVASDRDTFFDPFTILYAADSLQEKDDLDIFGLSFFRNENFTFQPSLNVATPKDYLIGPGDQVIIDIWGASQQSYALDVSPEGSISVPKLGPVYLNGLTIEKAELRIKNRLKGIYSTLGSSTFAQLSLGQIRTIKVNIVGEVENPGTYTLSSFGTTFNALYLAGGPTEVGSLRKIKVFRSGREVATLDAYDYLIYGAGENITLQDQDVLMVHPYVNRVAIEGEVKRPAYYEILENETLQKLLEFAGGFSENAYKQSISLRRNLSNQKTVKTVNYDSLKYFSLKSGDRVNIGKISSVFQSRVRVEGAVNFPGEFEIVKGMTLADAIKLANGFRGDAFLDRAVLVRERDDLSLEAISFSPKEVIEGSLDIQLYNEDLIQIQSIYDLKEEAYVTIEGEIQSPGKYLFAEEMTVEDIIYLAGGFNESAARSFVEVARRVKDTENESIISEIYNFPISQTLALSEVNSGFSLLPFDLVVIRRSPNYEKQSVVEIEGEVRYPGKYVLTKRDERISDLLERAGGLTGFAYADGATLIRRTEFFADEDEVGSDVVAQIRRSELQEQFRRDTALDVTSRQFKFQESVGIELSKIMDNPGSKFDLILKEGDILNVSRELQTVRIRGEVLYPATIRYDNMYSFKEFISNAGGFTEEAKKQSSYIIYANGKAERTKSFLGIKSYPKVLPGAEVIVPRKSLREPLPPQAWIALASSTGTLALIIQQVIQNSR